MESLIRKCRGTTFVARPRARGEREEVRAPRSCCRLVVDLAAESLLLLPLLLLLLLLLVPDEESAAERPLLVPGSAQMPSSPPSGTGKPNASGRKLGRGVTPHAFLQPTARDAT